MSRAPSRPRPKAVLTLSYICLVCCLLRYIILGTRIKLLFMFESVFACFVSGPLGYAEQRAMWMALGRRMPTAGPSAGWRASKIVI